MLSGRSFAALTLRIVDRRLCRTGSATCRMHLITAAASLSLTL